MKIKNLQQRGFTLIELLVVITIIAILASIAAPVYNSITKRAKVTKSLAHAKQIALALKNYAIDEDGVYPKSDTDANEAFRQMFSRSFNSEKLFYVAGSAWTPEPVDNEVGTAEDDYAQALEGGENHWAYVSGLTDSDKGNLPLVADGFGDSVGVYAEARSEKGGVWEGEKAIVIRNDGSGAAEKLTADFKVEEQKGEQDVDIFTSEYFGGSEEPNILNPAEPQ